MFATVHVFYLLGMLVTLIAFTSIEALPLKLAESAAQNPTQLFNFNDYAGEQPEDQFEAFNSRQLVNPFAEQAVQKRRFAMGEN